MARGLLKKTGGGGGMPQQQQPAGGGAGGQDQMMATQQQQQAPEAGGDFEQATPEEQAAYEQYVTNGMQLMYSEQVLPQVMQSLQGGGNPIEGLANTLAMVAVRLDESAKDSGGEVEGYIKFQGATELLGQLAELAEEAGIHEYSDQDMESALMLALDIYRNAQEQKGELPKEQLQEDMATILQAEQEGTLGQMLPGIEQYAMQHQQQAGGGQQPPQGGGGPRRRRGLMG